MQRCLRRLPGSARGHRQQSSRQESLVQQTLGPGSGRGSSSTAHIVVGRIRDIFSRWESLRRITNEDRFGALRATGAVLGLLVGSSLSASSLRRHTSSPAWCFCASRSRPWQCRARFKASSGLCREFSVIIVLLFVVQIILGFASSGRREPSYRLQRSHRGRRIIRRDHLGGLHRDETGQPQHRKGDQRTRRRCLGYCSEIRGRSTRPLIRVGEPGSLSSGRGADGA